MHANNLFVDDVNREESKGNGSGQSMAASVDPPRGRVPEMTVDQGSNEILLLESAGVKTDEWTSCKEKLR